jgi:type IV fimbrial biogenesis protein FimT
VDAGTDTILRIQRAFSGTDTLVPDNALPAVTFNREGFASGLPGTVTMKLHDSTNAHGYSRCLQVTIIGAMTTQSYGQGNCT